jgi:hypothetical protein
LANLNHWFKNVLIRLYFKYFFIHGLVLVHLVQSCEIMCLNLSQMRISSVCLPRHVENRHYKSYE